MHNSVFAPGARLPVSLSDGKMCSFTACFEPARAAIMLLLKHAARGLSIFIFAFAQPILTSYA
jgi:hypothetical protein